jgi:hypothetical protein
MIEFVFTVDYEIFGNGEGSLRELVYYPTEKLRAVFQRRNAHFVVFAEAAELEMIDACKTDSAVDLVKQQIRDLFREGFEIGLHLHPQWYNGKYEAGKWKLDYAEYNLCMLPRERIARIIERSISYLRKILDMPDFTPLSFRAGNWLFQPAKTAASLLAERGIKIDSSVFKGGVQNRHNLDYRKSLRNGYYWRFSNDVNLHDQNGALLELPIYTQMVATWKLLSAKRIGLNQNSFAATQNSKEKLMRLSDFLRLWCPMKLDYCRMTKKELINIVESIIQKDQEDPNSFHPIVAIGHTKDLFDVETIEEFLFYLDEKSIKIKTFGEIYPKCIQ